MEPTKNQLPPNLKNGSDTRDPMTNIEPSTTGSPDPGAKSVAADAKGLATKVAGQAKDLISDQLMEQQDRSADKLGQVAAAVRRSGEELGDSAAPYVEKAAAMIERVSDTVRNATVRGMMQSTERFARRDPLLFLGGAFTLGLIAARFLKSSAHHPEEGQRLLESGDARGGDGIR